MNRPTRLCHTYKKHAAKIGLSILLLMVASFLKANATSYQSGPEVGYVAPRLKVTQWLQTPSGAATEWPTNKVIVLEFWATWCGPCVGAIPHLNELADQFKDKPVQFIAATDQSEEDVSKFLRKTPIHAWVALSEDAGFGTNKPYQIQAIPHTVIIDAHGRIAAILDPRALKPEMIELCLDDKPLPQANEPGGEVVPGAVPGEYRIGRKPLFQALIRPVSKTNQIESWNDNGLTLQPGQLNHAIYDVFNVRKSRLITEAPLPEGWYDFYFSLPEVDGRSQGKGWLEKVFAQVVEATFGLTIQREKRELDVLVLTTNASSLEKLSRSTNPGGGNLIGWGEVRGMDRPLGDLAEGLEYRVSKPVIDETGLTNRYSYDVKWEQKDYFHPNPEGMIAAVKALGLDLKPAKRSLEVVVVRKPAEPAPNHDASESASAK